MRNGRLERTQPPVSVERGSRPTLAGLVRRAVEDLFANLFVDNGLDLGLGQSDAENLLDAAGVVDGDALDLLGGQILIDLLLAIGREDDIAHAGTLGGEELLLDAADRK